MSDLPAAESSQRFERAILRFELCLSRFEEVIEELHVVVVKAGRTEAPPGEPEKAPATAAQKEPPPVGPKRRQRLADAAAPPVVVKKRRTKQAPPRTPQLPPAQDPDSRAQRAQELKAKHENESDNGESEGT